MHCSVAQQNKIAQHLRRILGEKLHLPMDETFPTRGVEKLPSPVQLKFKVLVKGRTLTDDESQVGEYGGRGERRVGERRGRGEGGRESTRGALGKEFNHSMWSVYIRVRGFGEQD
ncbi:MAG: hypothetical protein SGPRY_011537, partial [Prymnesium sp.]